MNDLALAEARQSVLIDDVNGFAAEFALNFTAALAEMGDVMPQSAASKRGSGRRRPSGAGAGAPQQFFTSRELVEQMISVVMRNTLVHRTPAKAVLDQGSFELLAVIDRLLPEARNRHSEETIEKLVDALVETHDPLARTEKQIGAANARARLRFMDEIQTLSSDEVAKAAGHSARNRSQTASRWKSEGRIFSVRWQGQERYPAFQFRDGRPLPVIKEALAALSGDLSPWETAFWFVSTNGWLEGKAPYEMLDAPDRVVSAAREQGQAVVG